jgi:hypothetical protein
MPVEDDAPRELVWGSMNAFAYIPTVPGPALRVLMYLVGSQEPGGRIVITQEKIAEDLAIHRSLAGTALQHLRFANVVTKPGNGVYQLNAMIAGYRTPVEALQAIGVMPDEDRLDHEDFEERYQRALHAHEAEKKRRARRKAPVTSLDTKRASLRPIEG